MHRLLSLMLCSLLAVPAAADRPATEPSVTVGVLGGVTRAPWASADWRTDLVGVRASVGLDDDVSIVASFAGGSLEVGDQLEMLPSRAYELQAGVARAWCTAASRVWCVLPAAATGVQLGTTRYEGYAYPDPGGVADPLEDAFRRGFVEGRATGRVRVAGRVGITLGLGARLATALDELDPALEVSSSIGLDVGW